MEFDLQHGITLNVDEVIPLGLIMNELISNSLKYAFPEAGRGGRIHISVHRAEDGLISFTVRDNGVGLPPNYDARRAATLGMQLVTALTGQLKGALTVKSEGGGTEFKVEFRA